MPDPKKMMKKTIKKLIPRVRQLEYIKPNFKNDYDGMCWEKVNMATLKFREIIIEISRTSSGNIEGHVVNNDVLSPQKVNAMNKNLEMLIGLYTPQPGSFLTSITNAIALWIVNGLGKEAEIIEYDKVNHDLDLIY